jgi:WD40 repeat protein
VVLLLDQLDEYFVYHGSDGPLVDALEKLLRRPGLRVNVLLAVREDALAQLDAFSGRLPRIFDNLLRLEQLDRRGAREAIVGPLGAYTALTGESVAAEPALVATLQDEVSEGLGTPFLQLVLERLWDEERSDGSHELRLATLQRLGGSATIARRHVEGTLGQLPADERPAAARIVRQLVTPSGTKVALTEADLAGYADIPRERLRPLLDRLAGERILRAVDELDDRGPRYEIFHDVLAQPLLAWRQSFDVLRARSGARRVAAGSLAALLIVAALALYALTQRSSAQSQALHARAHELAAQALAEVPADPAASLQLALRAAKLAPDAETASVLRSGLLAMRERRVLRLGGAIVAASFAPHGERLLAASDNGTAGLYDAAGRRLLALPIHGALSRAAWSADGTEIVTGAVDGTATIWDARTGHPLKVVRTPAPVTALSFSGHVLLVGSGGHVRLVFGTHGTTRTFRLSGAVVAAALRPGARIIAVATKHGGHVTTQLVDVRSRLVLRTLPERGISVLTFSPDGTLLATGSTDKTAGLWAATTGRLRRVLRQRGHIVGLRFSRNGRTLITASADGTAAVWGVTTGQRQLLLVGATGAAEDAAISPSGSEYAVAFADRVARLYDSIDGRLLAPLAGHTGAVTSVGFDGSGRVLATGGDDGTVRLWDANASDQLTPTPQSIPTAVRARAISPDGNTVATRKERDAYLVDAKTGRVLHRLSRHRSLVTDAEFSPDGGLLVTASLDHDARIWDVRTGHLLRVLRGHFFPVYAASFSPNAQWVVTASQFTAGLWNAQTGQLVEYLRGAAPPLTNAVFAAGGTTILATNKNGKVRAAQCVVCRQLPGLQQAAAERLAGLR